MSAKSSVALVATASPMRGLSRARSAPPRQTVRMALHPETRKLARHGRFELGVLSSQCLSRRIPNKPTLEKEVAAWQDHRNKHHAKANWQFTTDDARVKLKRLYPSF